MRKDAERIAVYSRKSKFTGKGESIENQVGLCREYISAHYGAEAAENIDVYEDEGFSGGNLRRPDFIRMMDAARNHAFRAIVVYRLDRISRSIGDFAGLIDELGALGIDFVSIREQFDTSSPMGRAMMYIASVFSQLERETIAERIRDNMQELAKTGRWLGGTTPTGYSSERAERVSVDGKLKKACLLRLIPEQAETVKTIFALYAKSGSLTQTEAELLNRRIKTKTGRDFSRFSIKAILQNPVYMISDREAYDYFLQRDAELFSEPDSFDGVRGIMAYNRTAQEKGKTTVYLPVSEWIVCVGEHPGIIPAKDWIAVQESLERNGSRAYGRPRGNEALLTGLLYCRCGGRMYPKLSGRVSECGALAYTYVCQLKEHSRGGLCGGKNVGGNALDAKVFGWIKEMQEDKTELAGQLRRRRQVCTAGADRGENPEALRREKAEAERKITALVDLLAELKEDGAREGVVQRIALLDLQRRETQERINTAEMQEASHELGYETFEAAAALLAEFAGCAQASGIERKRAAVRVLVGRAVWDGERVELFLPEAVEARADNIKAHQREDSK